MSSSYLQSSRLTRRRGLMEPAAEAASDQACRTLRLPALRQ
ncbi:hypothetical protein EDD29_5190 [Actinocorallia herbida]|uniref:Uncharacterized protein n=1 Tax=Actinocorallia herbida TaxID=58109 RepID=A0A3N1D209_9ACTN|nr:hypothetical protein [Actinocorallia herbida]ROO87577.1 hypothetical protein EDD29_5190 [Actinocorallia herbida]